MQTHTAHKMKFSIKDFFSKSDQIESFLNLDLATFTGEILNGKLLFFHSEICKFVDMLQLKLMAATRNATLG